MHPRIFQNINDRAETGRETWHPDSSSKWGLVVSYRETHVDSRLCHLCSNVPAATYELCASGQLDEHSLCAEGNQWTPAAGAAKLRRWCTWNHQPCPPRSSPQGAYSSGFPTEAIVSVMSMR